MLYLRQDGKQGDFRGWCTITNNSGATWQDAKLKLLAGEVMRAAPRLGRGGFGGGGYEQTKAMDVGFAKESFAEYHLYTLGRPTTVAQNEQKQVSLLEATDIAATKRLIVDPMRGYYGYQPVPVEDEGDGEDDDDREDEQEGEPPRRSGRFRHNVSPIQRMNGDRAPVPAKKAAAPGRSSIRSIKSNSAIRSVLQADPVSMSPVPAAMP